MHNKSCPVLAFNTMPRHTIAAPLHLLNFTSLYYPLIIMK